MVFFRTADGWCTHSRTSLGCAGGGGLPSGFSGVSSEVGPDQTCIETVTGKEVAVLEVAPAAGPIVALEPLDGSNHAPVNVFAACWRPPIDIGPTTVRGLDQDGELVGQQHGHGGPPTVAS